jgi:hypothetical protein
MVGPNNLNPSRFEDSIAILVEGERRKMCRIRSKGHRWGNGHKLMVVAPADNNRRQQVSPKINTSAPKTGQTIY